MAIPTGVERNGSVAALGTLIQVPAQGGGAALFDGPQHFQVLPGKPVAVLVDESLSGHADQVGHLPLRWPHLLVQLVPESERIQGAGRSAEMPPGKMQVNRGFLKVPMTQQHLDGSKVRPGFQQMGGKAVPPIPHAE
jgi:hypothetical protein